VGVQGKGPLPNQQLQRTRAVFTVHARRCTGTTVLPGSAERGVRRQPENKMPNKPEERIYIEWLVKAIGLQHCEILDCESPDFLINVGPRKIGIEVTKFLPKKLGGTPLPQEQASLRKQLLNKAKVLWFSRNLPPISLLAVFEPVLLLTKRTAREIAQEILLYLMKQEVQAEISKQRMCVLDCSDDIPHLRKLIASQMPSKSHCLWQESLGGWARVASKDDIEDMVSAKSSKIKLYQSKASEIWLVCVFQNLEAGECVSIPQEPITFNIRTTFNKVYLMNGLAFHYVEVPVDNAA
jgi:hypothetical protein